MKLVYGGNSMKLRWILVFVCLLFVACDADSESETVAGSNAPVSVEEDSPNESPGVLYAEIKARYDKSFEEFQSVYQSAPKKDRRKIVKEKLPNVGDYAIEFLRIAEGNPDDPAAIDSLIWIISRVRDDPAMVNQAYAILLDKYIDSEKLDKVCFELAKCHPCEQVEDRLKTIQASSHHDRVKASAVYALAKFFRQAKSAKEHLADGEKSFYDEESKEYLASLEIDEDKLVRLYNELITNYGELRPAEKSRDYKTIAGRALFELQHLSIGKKAPDIEGKDLDGVSFKLSDYRGKVVLLDFWGDW